MIVQGGFRVLAGMAPVPVHAPARPYTPCKRCNGEGAYWVTKAYYNSRTKKTESRNEYLVCEKCGGSGRA